MAPIRCDDNWSDSDEDACPSGVETNVLLGIPDGKIENEDDLIDAAVSRIGGLPALLPSNEPSFASSSCKSCSQPMELLVQLWCPFENSPMDRALYVWGCALAGCQGKDGCVRAWRGLRYNETYAAKLKRKQKKAMELQKDKRSQQNQSVSMQSNPFTMTGDLSSLGSFTLHNNPFSFGNHSSDTSILSSPGTEDPVVVTSYGAGDEDKTETDDNDDRDVETKNESDTESSDSLVTALASTSITDSAWKAAPSYPPLYLSTSTEYLPPQAKAPKGLSVEDDVGEEYKNITWAKEKYENSLELDQVFERFTLRVAIEGQQCIRYELGGSPLPFASDRVSDLFWPKPPSDTPPITKPDFKVVRPLKRAYDATQVPRCPSCNAPRVFECQLMPNLINVLRPTWEEGLEGKLNRMTTAERRKQVEKSLKKSEGDGDGKRGMEWGTCLIFSCEKDCRMEDGQEVKEVWREEVVYLQWDV